MTDSIETLVARGVALLDEKLPGWWKRIDVIKLDLGSGCGCVLGQTWDEPVPERSAYTPYAFHANALFGDWDCDNEAARYGFNVTGDEYRDAFDALTAEWRRVILARRGGEAS
jgi:hypothetical protein